MLGEGRGIVFLSFSTPRDPRLAPPPLQTGNGPASTASPVCYLLIVTEGGRLLVWDMSQLRAVAEASLKSLLSPQLENPAAREPNVDRRLLSAQVETREPQDARNQHMLGEQVVVTVLVLSSHVLPGSGSSPARTHSSVEAFVLHQGLGTWLRVGDGRFFASDFFSMLPPVSKSGPAERLQAECAASSSPPPASALLRLDSHGEPSGFQAGLTLAHLEERLAATAALRSSHEFREWFQRYVRALVAMGGESRLRLVCDVLLSSSLQGSFPPGTLLGTLSGLATDSGHELLEKVVFPACAGTSSFQRLALEYSAQLKALDIDKLLEPTDNAGGAKAAALHEE